MHTYIHIHYCLNYILHKLELTSLIFNCCSSCEIFNNLSSSSCKDNYITNNILQLQYYKLCCLVKTHKYMYNESV